MPPPDLPAPPSEKTPSMLSRKFGPELHNYFAGNPLNRVSFLRPDHVFLDAALRHKSTQFLLFHNMGPLTESPKKIQFVQWDDVGRIVDPGDGGPFQKSEDDDIKEYDSGKWSPTIVFLGLDRRTEKEQDVFTYKNRYKGTPYFALDLSAPAAFIDKAKTSALTDAVKKLIEKYESENLEFVGNRMNLFLEPQEAAIYAEARHTIDWNVRNPFCAQCGNRTLSTHAGWKRACPPADTATNTERPSCATRQGISNLSFPRTDAVIIVAIVSADGQKMLLGRSKRFPPGMYSTLAGFLEPGEALEEAVRREVWEESGVAVSRVVFHSSQPWPYPANLMMGAIAQAAPGEDEREPDLDHDAELESAKWFTLEEIREALKGTAWAEKGLGASDPIGGESKPDIPLKVPPRTAIAHQLMAAVASGGFIGGESKI
jgi:NAD+ diphosphatase